MWICVSCIKLSVQRRVLQQATDYDVTGGCERLSSCNVKKPLEVCRGMQHSKPLQGYHAIVYTQLNVCSHTVNVCR